MRLSTKNVLPNSEGFYAAKFDSIGSPVLVIDPQTAAILDANKAACKFYGYSHTDFIQKKILDLAVIPAEEAWQRIQKIAAGEITHMDLQHRLSSGEIRDVEVDLGRDLLDTTPVNIATIHDVTEREQAKNRLQKSEESYRLLFQNMREGFSLYEVITDARGKSIDARILAANTAYEHHTGLKPLDVIGRTILEVMPQTALSQLEPYFKVAQTGEPISLEYFSTAFQRHYRTKTFCPQIGLFATIVEDVTERKQTEEKLRESEARFSTVFHSSHDAISITRLSDDIYLDVNEAFCKVFGLTYEQVIGRTGQELNIAANPEQRKEIMSRLRSQGQVTNFESQFHNHIGQTGYLLISAKIVKVFEQDCMVIFGKDITLRKQAEAALQAAHDELELRVQERTAELRRSLERLDLSTNAAKMGIWDWDIQKNELIWDQQMYTLYGVKPEDFSGAYEAWLNGIHPNDRETSNQASEQARNGEKPYNTEFRILWPDGSTRWLKADGQVFWDASGNPIRMLGVNYDITESKHAETKLRESQFRTGMAILGANEGTWEWNIQTGETIFNERWAQIIGYTLKELEPTSIQTWIDLCHPNDLKISDEQLQNHFSGKSEFYACEVRMKHKDGSWVWVFDSGKTMDYTEDGKPLHMFGTHIDVTERKQAETKLIETNIALEKALQIKDEFLAAMSHELRTPINGIMGMTELMQMTATNTLNVKQIKYLTIIEKSGQRLLDMVNNVLEYTQLQAGTLKADMRLSILDEVCSMAVQQISLLADSKQQHVRCILNPSHITVLTDEIWLQKILFLLLDNASKFTPTGGEFGIEAMGTSETGFVEITVWDTGMGITENDFPRLFKPFVQLDASLARQYEGTGLGLALVKRITELLNGTVSVQSTLGRGSRFTITLPWK